MFRTPEATDTRHLWMMQQCRGIADVVHRVIEVMTCAEMILLSSRSQGIYFQHTATRTIEQNNSYVLKYAASDA